MNRENRKMEGRPDRALDTRGSEDTTVPSESKSYQSQVKTSLELPWPAQGETGRSSKGTAEQALPAWIKAQVKQLEMRRKARHPLDKPGLGD